jgi:hypothetical protein
MLLIMGNILNHEVDCIKVNKLRFKLSKINKLQSQFFLESSFNLCFNYIRQHIDIFEQTI